ncbi:NADH dehydrogenase [Nocardia otitidiscaviarum]|uniref:NADH:ubiquinone reductase (non-electrogenic) n=1 Tax=Nocardia otitidiscaviarum TaxID=1823 RepID=A0A378YNN1_9NOCA|nr:NAD(P)/FAD-dependent oxidoreductase [Nocardia otitidiscaviarum]MBF6182761.1 NAD(P)/FAD-dependent oxidoreductase [Nocardia otitidiscaviarum]MCP9623690.1 NAD(P)/FAD-dependent oxidoreductase [Nocardia otitidiscaviarum]QDP81006.1 NAD(P)/FAD-dependent oxidoreductase [Nocardia otitidiscaviarum]SUA78815.1 NADH dehydrogenase [Nocardia otitidiscaviarum]
MQYLDSGIEATDVVIVGSGFGGLAAAKQLNKSGIDYVLISATPEHLFQPLLYQVATGVLASDEIAPPIKNIIRHHKHGEARLGTVVGIDAEDAVLTYETPEGLRRIRYNKLIAATGASQSYFGRDDFADKTFSLKTIDDAKRLRAQIEHVFAMAENADPATRERLLSFVVVGAGATGVEVAGQLKELSKRHYRQEVSVTLVEGAGAVLPPFGGNLSEYAKRSLADSGVEVLLDTFVTDIELGKVTVKSKDGVERGIAAETVVWSAGVQAGGFARLLAEATGCETDRAGRLLVNPDLTVGGHADIYAIGDMTSLNGYPGQSPVAMQEGRHVADIIRRKKQVATPFVYWDKGSMAVISRFSAVTKVNDKIKFTGTVAWVAWLAVHLFYLVGFRNRFAAVFSWLVAFIGTGRPGFDEVEKPAAPEISEYRRAA